MQLLKQWAISVCASGILGTVFSMIAPKGSMDKTIKLMIAIFIFTSMLVPFVSAEKLNFDEFYQADHSEVSQEELQAQSNALTMKTTKISIEKAVSSFLEKQQHTNCRVKAILEVDAEYYVNVKRLELYFTEASIKQSEKIKALVSDEFKMETIILPMGAYDNET